MRLRDKLIALCALVAAVPLATIGLLTVRWNQDALEAEIRARQDAVAHHAAQTLAADVGGLVRRLDRTAGTFAWADLSEAEATGALRLLYREDARVTIAALLDRAGTPLVPLVLDAAGHPPVTAAGQRAFRDRAPVARALAEGGRVVVVSPVYRVDGGPPRVAVAVPRTCAGGAPCAACAEIDLSPLGEMLHPSLEGSRVRVVDAEGHVVVSNGSAGSATSGPDAVVRDFLERKPGNARRYVDGDRVTIAAYAPVGTLGWGVIVERSATSALAPVARMRLLTVGWTLVATALAVLLAALFARRLTRALGRLADGARELGKGNLAHRVETRGRDEVAELGSTLNAMGTELAASREEILRWNRELEQRVEERTRELKEAQAQLVQAQKLAAIGQLGAGVAHEINNPLAGIIGHIQLLLLNRPAEDRDAKTLRHIEEAARRASTIVQNLLRFSVQHAAAVMSTVDLNAALRDTLTLTEQTLADSRVAVEWRLAEPAPRARADAGQIAQVLLNLVANARTAMKQGGTLTLETFGASGDPALVGFRVRDTGKGIAPEHRERIFEPFFTTKDEWSNVGLGLSVSYRIVADHGGTITVESEVGRGSALTVRLPAAEAG